MMSILSLFLYSASLSFILLCTLMTLVLLLSFTAVEIEAHRGQRCFPQFHKTAKYETQKSLVWSDLLIFPHLCSISSMIHTSACFFLLLAVSVPIYSTLYQAFNRQPLVTHDVQICYSLPFLSAQDNVGKMREGDIFCNLTKYYGLGIQLGLVIFLSRKHKNSIFSFFFQK